MKRPSSVKFKEKSQEASGKQEKLKKNLSLSLNTGPPADSGIIAFNKPCIVLQSMIAWILHELI